MSLDLEHIDIKRKKQTTEKKEMYNGKTKNTQRIKQFNNIISVRDLFLFLYNGMYIVHTILQ